MSWIKRRFARAEKAGLQETLTMLRRYVVAEALAPLRHLGKRIAIGLAGGLLCGIGAVFLLIGFLRLVEGESGSTFAGNWSFAPYLFTAVLAGLMITLSLRLFVRSRRS